MAAGEMEALLEVGWRDMNGGAELTLIHTYINFLKCDFGGECMLDELDGIVSFKELGMGVWTMGSKEENFIDKTQPEGGYLDSGVKEILFKETHEQVGIGRGHTGAHGGSINLEVMSGVKGEMVVG